MANKEYTVSQVNRYLARMMQEDFFLSHITVSGEISNLKMHPSGHIYFTLKDQASQLSGINSMTGLTVREVNVKISGVVNKENE